MTRRRFVLGSSAVLLVWISAGPVWACSGLIGAGGAVNLGRTTTLAAHLDGVEHYITAFKFSGGGGQFGSIVPLPAVPTNIEKGGDWTLQRLVRETSPVVTTGVALSASTTGGGAEVVYQTRVDALDLTVLKGGGAAVGKWAKDHGFLLPPDAPEILDFYAERSPIFLTAVFDADAARERGQEIGDGTPIHITISTANPWVPLRILSLGKPAEDFVEADVYLLTSRRPALLPIRAPGWTLERRVEASESLLADLRTDRGMEWLPESGMWLTHFDMAAAARTVRYDLAVDVSGRGKPSWVAAGLKPKPEPSPEAVRSEPPPPSPSPATADETPKAVVPARSQRPLLMDLALWIVGAATLLVTAALIRKPKRASR